jgi:hypothetical protein
MGELMKFNEIKDDNGTSLQSYVDLLQTKATEHDLFCTVVFAGKEGTKNTGIHAITTVDGPPERALLLLAMAMYRLTYAQQREVLAAFALISREDSEPMITPVSPGKAN